MSEYAGKERRRYPRIGKTVVVHYSVVESELSHRTLEDEYVGSSINLSAGGMLLRTTVNIPLGTQLELKFRLSRLRGELVLLAQVLRYEVAKYSGLYYIPIEFTSITSEQRSEIQQFVSKHQVNPSSET